MKMRNGQVWKSISCGPPRAIALPIARVPKATFTWHGFSTRAEPRPSKWKRLHEYNTSEAIFMHGARNRTLLLPGKYGLSPVKFNARVTNPCHGRPSFLCGRRLCDSAGVHSSNASEPTIISGEAGVGVAGALTLAVGGPAGIGAGVPASAAHRAFHVMAGAGGASR